MNTKDYLEEFKYCSSIDMVLEIMKNKLFPGTENNFLSPVISFKAKRHDVKDDTICLPIEGSIAIALRTVLFMKLDGKIGEIPISGGSAEVFARTRAMLNSFNEYAEENDLKFSEINDLSSEFITNWIYWKKAQESNKPNTEYVKWSTIVALLRGLHLWMKANSQLPLPLRLPYDLFRKSKGYKKLIVETRKERIKYEDEGADTPPYPLEYMKTIVSAALEYIDDYTDEIMDAAQRYFVFKKNPAIYSGISHEMCRYFRTTEIEFSEPLLAPTQRHTLRIRGIGHWTSNPELPGIGSSGATVKAIETLQASCIIVVLMLTAMRKGEFHSLYRFPREKEEEPYLSDEAMRLSRMIYKTSKSKNGELLEMPVPQIVIKALGILSELSTYYDDKKDGMLMFRTITQLDSNETDGRINLLINNFSERVELPYPPNPHAFRHGMAFILSYFNDSNGTELAMRFLGHKSIKMTKQYLKHYRLLLARIKEIMIENNPNFKEVNDEYEFEASVVHAKKIQDSIDNNEKIYGGLVNRFKGSIHGSARTIFTKGIVTMAMNHQTKIVRTPTNMCVLFIGDNIEKRCQMGLTDKILSSGEAYTKNSYEVYASRCQGASCACSVFLESDIAELADSNNPSLSEFPDELKERLSGNTVFIADRIESPHAKIVKQYKQDKIEKEA